MKTLQEQGQSFGWFCKIISFMASFMETEWNWQVEQEENNGTC